MIWFLLYPIRGTTNPPRLADNHPIRRAFYRHGLFTAQHWLIAMLAAVALGVACSYPTVFLSENPTAGFTRVPQNVWTTAKSVDLNQSSRADVEMRQVWVHGSYMRALEPQVLKSALVIQQLLVGGEDLVSSLPETSEKIVSGELSSAWHSPLMYWNSSSTAIDQDPDIVGTINEQAKRTSALNVALRPASVLAGKVFHHRKLVAADALVLTLLNKVDDSSGSKWQDQMHHLEDEVCENCTLYPPHGEISRSRLYEFSFTPLSSRENLALAMAYSCMLLYVVVSLRRLRAFHSRFGLVVTAITQLATSILASFTICGMLKINLATIPSNAYPFIVLVIGLENMFRMINAVLAYPPTMATDVRIANALGDIGPLSVATAVQNIIILWLLAIVVSPGVKAFCAFAAIATLFDSFFLLTFFVAVLNVDIRRLELQDSLSRSNQARSSRRRSPVQQTWLDAMMHGRVPISTRMAGSVVTTTFILSLNYHFFETREQALSLRHLLGLFFGQLKSDIPAVADFEYFAPMNVSLTLGEWIRMQDFDTAREVMRLVRPGASDLVIRIFSPLIVVLSGSDRTGVPHGYDVLADALRGFALHHFYPFAVAIIFVVAFVAVLMNFLLWAEPSESSEATTRRMEEPLKVQHIDLPHKLDIVKIAGSSKGHFATIGLDRTISISTLGRADSSHTVLFLPTDLTDRLRWPLRQLAISDEGDYVALQCADDHIVFYSTERHGLIRYSLRLPDDHPTLLFDFMKSCKAHVQSDHFVVLTAGGRVASLNLTSGESSVMELSARPLRGGKVHVSEKQECSLIVVSDDARITTYSFRGAGWSYLISGKLHRGQSSGLIETIVHMETIDNTSLDTLAISFDAAVHFVDTVTLRTISTMQSDQPSTDSRVVLGRSTNCSNCGSTAYHEITLVGKNLDGSDITLTTKRSCQVSGDSQGLCLSDNCASSHLLATSFTPQAAISDPGVCAVLTAYAIVGVRRRMDIAPAAPPNGIRSRRNTRTILVPTIDKDEWEAYASLPSGDFHAVSLATDDIDQESTLYVTQPGPIATLDARSIAIAFGNSVKVLTISHSRTTTPSWNAHVSSSDGRRRQGEGRKAV